MNGLREYFEVRQIGGGQLTEARIREMISEACRQTVVWRIWCIESKIYWICCQLHLRDP